MNEQNYKEVSTIGRWGRMHGRYLKDNHPVRYTVLLLSGKLNGYLAELDQQVKKQLELIVQQMAECEDVTEELKATDQMEWVRRINNIRNRAEEVIKTRPRERRISICSSIVLKSLSAMKNLLYKQNAPKCAYAMRRGLGELLPL